MRTVKALFCVSICIFASTALVYAQKNDKDTRATAAAVQTIKIKDNSFDPAQITVKVGDQVIFDNAGANTHTATSDDIKTGNPKDTFNTGRVKVGQKASLNFNTAGTFKYHCEFHNGMAGTITVEN